MASNRSKKKSTNKQSSSTTKPSTRLSKSKQPQQTPKRRGRPPKQLEQTPKRRGRPPKQVEQTPKRRARKAILVKQKPNRQKSDWNVLSSQISEYCKKRQDGKPCTRQKIAEIYNAIKDEQKTKGKKLSQQEIQSIIESKLAFVDVKSVPTLLRQFDWFRLVSVLVESSGSFFTDSDIIEINLSQIGLGKLQSPFFALEDYYIEEIYPTIQQYADEIEELTGSNFNSPPPQLLFNEDSSDVDKRKFIWYFEIETKEEKPKTQEPTPTEPISKPIETSEIDLEKAKKESFEAQKQAEEAKQKSLEAEQKMLAEKRALIADYRALFNDGIITKEELSELVRKIM